MGGHTTVYGSHQRQESVHAVAVSNMVDIFHSNLHNFHYRILQNPPRHSQSSTGNAFGLACAPVSIENAEAAEICDSDNFLDFTFSFGDECDCVLLGGQ